MLSLLPFVIVTVHEDRAKGGAALLPIIMHLSISHDELLRTTTEVAFPPPDAKKF